MSNAIRSPERILLLICFFCIMQCERPVNPFGPPLFYVTTIAGLSVRESPGLTGRLTDLLPFNTAVEIEERQTEIEEIGIYKGSWVKIRYSDADSQTGDDQNTIMKEGWVFDSFLSKRPVEKYYHVASIQGVELRRRPDLTAEVLLVIPYGTVGAVETAGRRIDRIQSVQGFWFRTTYEKEQGWLFSGQVGIANHRLELDTKDRLQIEDRELEEIETTFDELKSKAVRVDIHELSDFRLYTLQYRLKEHEVCDRIESQLVFERRRDGQLFATQSYRTKIVKLNYPLNGSLLVKVRPCSCCQTKDKLIAVFPDRAGPLFIPYSAENLEARCQTVRFGNVTPSYPIEIRAENRVDPESGDLFIFLQEPDCDIEDETITVNSRSFRSVRVVSDFQHDIFARFRFREGRLRSEYYRDRSIPPSLRNAWERSDPL